MVSKITITKITAIHFFGFVVFCVILYSCNLNSESNDYKKEVSANFDKYIKESPFYTIPKTDTHGFNKIRLQYREKYKSIISKKTKKIEHKKIGDIVREDIDTIAMSYYKLMEIDSAIKYCKVAITDLNYNKENLEKHFFLPQLLDKKGDIESALPLITQAEVTIQNSKEFTKNEKDDWLLTIYDYQIKINTIKGNYEEAFNYFLKANDLIAKKKIFVYYLPSIYNSISEMYKKLDREQEYYTALYYLYKALKLEVEVDSIDISSVAMTFNNIGETYELLNQHHQALAAFELSLKLKKSNYKIDPGIDLAYSYQNKGKSLIGLDSLKKAKTYLEYALKIRLSDKQFHYLPELINIYADLLIKQKEYEIAIDTLKFALKYAGNLNTEKRETYFLLKTAYENNHDSLNALINENKFYIEEGKLHRNIYNVDKEVWQGEVYGLSKSKKLQKDIIFILALVIVVCFVLLSIIYFQKRKINKRNLLIDNINSELQNRIKSLEKEEEEMQNVKKNLTNEIEKKHLQKLQDFTMKEIKILQDLAKNSKQIAMGDIINTGDKSTVVTRSKFKDSFNTYKNKYGTEGAQLIEKIDAELEKIKDPAASALFEKFKEESIKEEPNKSTMQSIWSSIEKILPKVEVIAKYGIEIAKLFL